MDDHFWPAIYPGIAVGLLYGVSLGGALNIALGGLGGLAASFVAFFALGSFFGQEGLLPLATLIALSLLGAVIMTRSARALRGVR